MGNKIFLFARSMAAAGILLLLRIVTAGKLVLATPLGLHLFLRKLFGEGGSRGPP
jgi:hypothetical protein